MKRVRQLHLYLGLFFAPTILFFSFTGALQTFHWHEGQAGSDYQPPAWLATLAQVHKKQSLEVPAKPRPIARAVAPAPPPRPAPPRRAIHESAPLKWFFAVMSIGLIGTTLLGIYLAVQYQRDRRILWGSLALGTVLPIVMAYL